MVSSHDAGKVHHRAVNACLFPLYACEGTHVVTVEGLGTRRSGLHPVQRAIAEAHGSQCGFCTPGFVMSMYALLRSSAGRPTRAEIEEAVGGNLCRCTGYRPILAGFARFAKDAPAAAYSDETLRGGPVGAGGRAVGCAGGCGDSCDGCDAVAVAGASGDAIPTCPSTGLPCSSGCGGGTPAGRALRGSEPDENTSAREPIFPPELKRRVARELFLPGANATWHRPTTLARLLALKKTRPDAKIVCGNTEVGVEVKFKHARYPTLIAPTHVPELAIFDVVTPPLDDDVDDDVDKKENEKRAGFVRVGAATTLSTLERRFRDVESTLGPSRVETLRATREQLRWFAGPQVRNVASVGGNACTASPISDLNPIWLACDATFVNESLDGGERRVAARDFFAGYRRCDVRPEEILREIEVPLTRRGEYVREFKQSHRREDDIAIVTACMRVRFRVGGAVGADDAEDAAPPTVAEIRLAFGGMSFKTVTCPKTEAALVGEPWCDATLRRALETLPEDLPMAADVPGGAPEYRSALASSFFFKFFAHCARRLVEDGLAPHAVDAAGLHPEDASASDRYRRSPLGGAQYYAVTREGRRVGQPTKHQSAEAHATGEAEYCDDVPKPAGTLHAALVLSTVAHADVVAVDPAPALAMPGVRGYFDHRDVPVNDVGPAVIDEEVFASRRVTCVGHQIGIVVADTREQAMDAARAVKVTYAELPAVFTIEEAIAAGSFHEHEGFTDHEIVDGDPDGAMAACEAAGRVVRGVARCGGQEHFYLEPMANLVWCGDNDELVTVSSTQCPQKHQKLIARALGMPCNRVVCKTKRVGGGFGGKETRAAFLNVCAAVPAFHLRRPVSLVLDRHVDMAVTGQRHAFLGEYQVGHDAEGRVLALRMRLYNNAGNSLDLSHAIMDRALFHSDGAYKIPNVRVSGRCCKTNLPSNTAFRGFGGPQGVLFAETWMDRIARRLGKTPESIREMNLYREGDACHFGQPMESSRLRACWDDATGGGAAGASLVARRAAAAAFNARHRHKKRGVAAVPVKFGISFTALFMNQAGALVHCYLDGTVLVTHGGVEMGQGLHTKMAQICAQELGVDVDSVYVAETSTDKVPNASPTAASASSDLYGAAVVDACAQINARLAPVKASLGEAASRNFAAVCEAAYFRRVDLSAHGWYVTPDLSWSWDGSKGRPFNYFCFGAATTEVEVDVLTGDARALRTDVCMDVGDSINPALDVGQVEGGFVQGLGWLTLEELKVGGASRPWIAPGALFTAGPGTYKIPAADDAPQEFNVTLLRDAPNPRAVASSKAVGEPPFLLANSVFFAIKDAIVAARRDAGLADDFELDAPATPERVRMACGGPIAERFCDPKTFRAALSC